MTYKLNPEIAKITSPVVLIFPNGERKQFENGTEAYSAVFENRYLIQELCAVNDAIEMKLVEQEAPIMNWCGESATSFF